MPFARCVDAAGDRRNNRKRIAGAYLCRLFGGQVTHVLVVEIKVDEGAQLAFRREEVIAEGGVRAGEAVECCRYGGCIDIDRWTATGVGSQRSGNEYLHREAAFCRCGAG